MHRTVFAEGIVYSLVTLPFLQTLVGLKCARTYIYIYAYRYTCGGCISSFSSGPLARLFLHAKDTYIFQHMAANVERDVDKHINY